MNENYEYFKVKNRTWRLITEREPTDTVGHTVLMSLATVDEEFTADARVIIEYYSEHFTMNPHAARSHYTSEAIAFATAISENDEEFKEPEHWYVRQVDKQEERLAMHRFCGVPLPFFWKLWRRPLEPKNIHIALADESSAQVTFTYFEEEDPLMSMSFDCYLDFDGLFDNLRFNIGHPIVPWLHSLEGRLYLFSDFDSIFELETDEVRYLVDLAK